MKLATLLFSMILLPMVAIASPFHEVDSFKQFQELTKGKPAFLFVSTPDCGATPHVLERLIVHNAKFGKTKIYHWSIKERTVQDTLPDTPFPILSYPTLNYYENGRRRDVLYGWQGRPDAEDNFLPDFLSRTIGDGTRKYARWTVAFRTAQPWDSADLISMLQRRPWFPHDLQGLNFSGVSLNQFTAFTGANLRRAKFVGATLKRVSFAGADLTGADFSSADLTEIHWGASICPDGSPSEQHEFSCAGHLGLKNRESP